VVAQALLWSSHYYLTREVIRDAATNSPCLNEDVKALLQNQQDLGDSFASLTNKKAGKRLAKALTEHINIAIEIVTASIKKQPTDQLVANWQSNASDIAKIYNKYNSKIKYSKMNETMQVHLNTTLAEATAILKGQCAASQSAGQVALNHINMMSAYISSSFA
jgi:hypothetical protein